MCIARQQVNNLERKVNKKEANHVGSFWDHINWLLFPGWQVSRFKLTSKNPERQVEGLKR